MPVKRRVAIDGRNVVDWLFCWYHRFLGWSHQLLKQRLIHDEATRALIEPCELVRQDETTHKYTSNPPSCIAL